MSLANFLTIYNSVYERLLKLYQAAAWSDMVNGSEVALGPLTERALLTFQGDEAVTSTAFDFLNRGTCSELERLQLERILRWGTEAPGSHPELVERRLLLESLQAARLTHGAHQFRGREVSLSELDRVLLRSRDPELRFEVWEAARRPERAIVDTWGLLRDVRNGCAEASGFDSYFDLKAGEVGFQTDELLQFLDTSIEETAPLFARVQSLAQAILRRRYETTKPYEHLESDDLVPHLMSDRFAQSWSHLVELEQDFDARFSVQSDLWAVEKAHEFWQSLGFRALPKSFFQRSIFGAVDSPEQGGGACWHMDLHEDVRVVLRLSRTSHWFGAAHHEVAHAYAYLCSATKGIPAVLRCSTNGPVQEGVAELLRLVSMQPAYLRHVGILEPDEPPCDDFLLKECFEVGIPFFRWGAGTMTRFEHAIYSERVPVEQWQPIWGAFAARYQGLRLEAHGASKDVCAPATNEHLLLHPGKYCSYALATLMKYQLHEYIAENILHQDPFECSYFGNPAVGKFLKKLLTESNKRPWRQVYSEMLGAPLSPSAMLRRFQAL